jgi:3-deoxy-D-manno-octulosonic acid kinase
VAGEPGTIPIGYEQLALGGTVLVAQREAIHAVRATLRSGTLYDYAAHHPEARALSGRGIAYAVPLPNDMRVVVRHNRHGGLLAPATGDRFLRPTRAPYELAVSLRLIANGVPTPPIVAYVVYPAGPFLRRTDTASLEIRDSADLATLLTEADDTRRHEALDATIRLIALLSQCGARHHDLNVKNVLLASADSRVPRSAFTAYVLDVDRVEFGRTGDHRITEHNLERFMRSARKWRERYGARADEDDLARVATSVRRLVSSGGTSSAPARSRS